MKEKNAEREIERDRTQRETENVRHLRFRRLTRNRPPPTAPPSHSKPSATSGFAVSLETVCRLSGEHSSTCFSR
jgi:hypothetical protein